MFHLPPEDRNLIITGYTGPNQPLVGRQLASRLQMTFVDVEGKIEERADMPLEELRTLYGEARFKTVAGDVIEEAALYRASVIRVSGQTLLQADYLAQLAATGPVICLVATLDVVLQRLYVALGARYHIPDERALVLGHVRREWGVRNREGVFPLDTSYLSRDEIVDAAVTLWQHTLTLA